MSDQTTTNDLDAEVESQTALALPSREVMSIIDPTLGPKLFPQAASQTEATAAEAAEAVDAEVTES